MIVKMERARATLNQALEKVTPQKEIYPTWKLKQVLDHITGWDELVAIAFRTHSKDEAPELAVKHGIDQYNADSVSTRKAMSLEQSRKAYDEARKTVLQVMRQMPIEKVSQKFRAPWGGMCTIASVVKIFVSHEMEHAKQIEEFI
jgi:hypothetical protein